MAIPGILMRLSEPLDGHSDPAISPASPCPNVQAIHRFVENDSQKPSRNTVYYLSDITPILTSPSAYDEDARTNGPALSSLSWIICSFTNSRDPSNPGLASTANQLHDSPPVPGSVLVSNGYTPKPGTEEEYNAWYDTEHGEKLTHVPGWNSARRYKFEKRYGDTDTSVYYGFNFYDEENGLGGPAWQAGVTEWTMKIRSNAAKPNMRRVWKVVSTSTA